MVNSSYPLGFGKICHPVSQRRDRQGTDPNPTEEILVLPHLSEVRNDLIGERYASLRTARPDVQVDHRRGIGADDTLSAPPRPQSRYDVQGGQVAATCSNTKRC